MAAAFKQDIIAEWLLDQGGNPNTVVLTSEGKMFFHSPLQCAARDGGISLIKRLLEAGADVNAKSIEIQGATALQFVAMRGHFEMLQILLEASADINAAPAPYGGRSAIEGAAEWGRLDIVKFLLDARADVRGKANLNYRRTVYRAYMHGHRTLVAMVQDWKRNKYGPEDCDSTQFIVEATRTYLHRYAEKHGKVSGYISDDLHCKICDPTFH